MKMHYFYGTIEDWVYFVNEKEIEQEMISSCTMYTSGGKQFVIATYWIGKMIKKELEAEIEELKDLLNRSNVRLAEEQIKNEELKKQIELNPALLVDDYKELTEKYEELKNENEQMHKAIQDVLNMINNFV